VRSAFLIFLLAALALLAAGASAAPRGAPLPDRQVGFDDFVMDWSPDGRIVYAHVFEPPFSSALVPVFYLAVMQADGSGKRILTRKHKVEYEEWDTAATWSPDGTLVAFIRFIALEKTDVYLVRPDGSGLRNLTATNEADEGQPLWAPDGRAIAFARVSEAHPQDSGIWLVRPDGTGLRQLTSGDDSAPRWSPDGQTIAFDRYRGNLQYAIFTVRVDGRGLRGVTDFGFVAVDQWSADGQSLLYEGRGGVWTIRADGSGRRKLAKGDRAAWSPDGKQLVFARTRIDRKGRQQHLIVVADAAGRHARAVFRGAEDASLSRAIWSRDSRFLAIAARRECNGLGVYVVQVAPLRARRISNGCRIIGTSRSDRLLGTRERDLIWGLEGNDVIYASPGNPDTLWKPRLDHNVVYAGPGNDRVVGGRGQDLLIGGPGRDFLSGRGQDDVIRSRDGERDVVVCGWGSDRVFADRLDRVAADCERVFR